MITNTWNITRQRWIARDEDSGCEGVGRTRAEAFVALQEALDRREEERRQRLVDSESLAIDASASQPQERDIRR